MHSVAKKSYFRWAFRENLCILLPTAWKGKLP